MMNRRTFLGIVAGGLVGGGGCLRGAGTEDDPNPGQNELRTDIPTGTWPTFQVDGGNTGFHPTASGPTESVTERWQFTFEDRREFSAPAVTDDTVYVGMEDRTVYAIDERDGTEVWRFEGEAVSPVSPTPSGSPTWLRGRLSPSMPAISDGKVYIWPGGHRVYALEAETGEKEWHFLMDISDKVITSHPTVVDGTVYIGGYALDAETGTERWSYEGKRYTTDVRTFTPGVVDGTVYAVGGSHVFALDADDGTEQWRYPNTSHNRGPEPRSSPTIANGGLYVGIPAECSAADCVPEGRMYALDASDGSEMWRHETEYPVGERVVTDGEVLYVSPANGRAGRSHVLALDLADGSKRWQIELENQTVNSLAVTGNTLYLSLGDIRDPTDILAVATKDGGTRYHYQSGGQEFMEGLAIVNDTIFITGRDGLFALQ